MAEFDINSVLSKFGDNPETKSSGSIDVDKILSQFKTADEPITVETKPTTTRVIIDTSPKPPISGLSKESSDEFNQTKQKKSLPVEVPALTSKSAYENLKSGKEMFSSGIEDVGSGHPYKGAAKTALGVVQILGSPVSGILEDTVGEYGNKVGPGFGDRAALVAGSVVPLVPGTGAVIKAIPKNKALSTLVESIGPENLASHVKELKSNPRLTSADLSPKVLQDIQNLFTTEGPHINYLSGASSARLAGSKDTVSSALDASMGASVNAAKKVEDLKLAAQEIGKKNIEPVLAAKPHVDITDLIKHIDSEIGYPAMKAIKEGKSPPLPLTPYQRELFDVRNKLRNPAWPDRDKMFAYTDQLHDAQIKLREKAQALASSADGSQRHDASQLLKFREKMKEAVGPEYKEALGKYAGQKKIEEAFHNGYDTILSNSKKLENDPSFFEKWVNSPSRKPGELEAAKEGARLRIDAEIKGARTAATNPSAKAIGIGQTEFSVQRIEALLGKEEATKLLKALDDERKIANTHNKVIEGSQTEMRRASKERMALPTPTEVMKSVPAVAAAEASSYFMGGYPLMGTALLAGAKIGATAKDIIKMKLAKEHNTQYAKLALPTEGPSRDALIKSLEAHIPGPKQSLVTRGANTLSKLVAP